MLKYLYLSLKVLIVGQARTTDPLDPDSIDDSIAATVPEIRTFGLWNNQISNEGEIAEPNYPAFWIDPVESEEPITAGVINLTQDFTFHLVYKSIRGTEEDDLAQMDLVDKVKDAIRRYAQTGNYGVFDIEGTNRDSDHGNLIDWQINATFTGRFQIVEPEGSKTTVDATLNPAIVLDIDNYDIRTGNGIFED